MPKAIFLLGPSGSGKTWVVRQLLASGAWEPWKIHGTLKGFRKGDWTILGPYTETAQCGGIDALRSPTEAKQLALRELQAGRNVLGEGLLLATTRSFWQDWNGLTLGDIAMCLLTTPLAKAEQNVLERQKKAGRERDFNRDRLVHVYQAARRRAEEWRARGGAVVALAPVEALYWLSEVIHAG
jgi:hypothetical protein